jgi:hypothetical protein
MHRMGHPLLWLSLTGLAAVIAIPAWLQPDQQNEDQSRPVVSTASLAYTAEVPPNPVYPRVQSGDVVFLNIVDTVVAEVRWEVPDPAVRVTSGELTVDLVLISSAGWRRVLTTGPTVQITGSDASARVPIDFGRAHRTAAEIDQRVGVAGTTTVEVHARTSVESQVLSAIGPPTDTRDTANFVWGFVLTPLTASPTGLPVQPGDDVAPNDSNRSVAEERTRTGTRLQEQVQFVTTQVPVPTVLDILGRSIPLTTIRILATAGVALFFSLTMFTFISRGLLRRRGEAAGIAAHNADRLVAVERIPAKRRAAALTVGSFAALRAMSREHGLLILVHESGDQIDYYVVDGAVTYRYSVEGVR